MARSPHLGCARAMVYYFHPPRPPWLLGKPNLLRLKANSKASILSRPDRITHFTMAAAMTPQVNGTSEIHADIPKTKKLILCFDGTGNQYSGDTSDTNIVKLYQKFDRKAPKQYHYYQREFGFLDPSPRKDNWITFSLPTC